MTKWDPNARPVADAEPGVRDDGTVVTPIEAVLDRGATRKLHAQAELSAQILEERAKRAAAPVHMEGLKPLPPGMPRLPNGVIPGGPDALSMTPSMRRAIPAPFSRESISIGKHGKTWAYLSADQVQPGDMVVDFGKVDESFENTVYQQITGRRVAVSVQRSLINVFGETRTFEPSDQLMVFRVHEDG
jgi:hypothetical protein